ncbi:MAG: hypothetical protein HRO68_06330 [Nitrosopumilus sp.]|nr:hypothetical protein [Nitrosopumilus sp.]
MLKFSNLIGPEELRITETQIVDKKLFRIVLAKPYQFRKEIEEKISRYKLYYDKAIDDADIVAALEDLLFRYENMFNDDSILPKEKMLLLRVLLDLRHTIHNPKDGRITTWPLKNRLTRDDSIF